MPVWLRRSGRFLVPAALVRLGAFGQFEFEHAVLQDCGGFGRIDVLGQIYNPEDFDFTLVKGSAAIDKGIFIANAYCVARTLPAAGFADPSIGRPPC